MALNQPPQRVLCAPDSFKGSLTASAAAHAMCHGARSAAPDLQAIARPLADGGEGTVQCFIEREPAAQRSTTVTGPLGEPVEAHWAMLADGTAVLEMAECAGLTLVPPELRDPWQTTSAGVGDLIKAALDANARRIWLGLGGSATNDAGIGAADVLGCEFYDAGGSRLQGPLTARSLERVNSLRTTTLDSRLATTPVSLLVDVQNPMTGRDGASYVFGPQKGARDIDALEQAVVHTTNILEQSCNRSIRELPGAGAAGGLAGGMKALLDADLRPGIDAILDYLNFDSLLTDCDLCITGEGQVDAQTALGKVCDGVLRRCQQHNVPVAMIAGRRGAGAASTLAQCKLHRILQDMDSHRSLHDTACLISEAAASLVNTMRDGHRE